ncbi:MAG TPA: hypothetical protein VKT28_02025 [Puia sp.]|nr:hypothetical protein [Puia sp.]
MFLPYKPVEHPEKFEQCCKPDPDPNPGTGDCCQDVWQTDKTETDTKLQKITTRADHKQKELTSKTEWCTTLKRWCDDWEAVDKYADDLCRNLELFHKHLCKVGEITQKTSDAVIILFCMIKELYIKVDELKEKYDELYKCIKCLKAPELESGGVRTCLDDYGVKLTAVINTRDDLIAKVVLTIQLSFELHDNISDEYGLKTVVEYWKGKFNCCDEETSSTDDDNKSVCDEREHCDLRPLITFPIKKSKYFVELKQHRDYMEKKVYEVKKESDHANERKAAMQALSDGLNNAINSVANSGKCK